jgi:phage terminase small subunit
MAKGKAKTKEITPQQRLFVLAYLETKPLSAAEAYRRVYGCSPATAETNGPRLLRSAQVQEVIAEKMAELERRSLLNIERLEEELVRLAFVDPRRAYDETGRLLRLDEMPEDVARAIQGFEQEALFDTVVVGEGPRGGEKKERVQVGVTTKVKWGSKVEAIKLGLQRRGALVEKKEVKVTDGAGGPEPTAEELAAVAALRHEVRGKGPGGAR